MNAAATAGTIALPKAWRIAALCSTPWANKQMLDSTGLCFPSGHWIHWRSEGIIFIMLCQSAESHDRYTSALSLALQVGNHSLIRRAIYILWRCLGRNSCAQWWLCTPHPKDGWCNGLGGWYCLFAYYYSLQQISHCNIWLMACWHVIIASNPHGWLNLSTTLRSWFSNNLSSELQTTSCNFMAP